MRYTIILSILLIMVLSACHEVQEEGRHFSRNPIVPGNFADPCILVYRDTFYLYATSGSEATVWRSSDFRNWKLRKLNWPTSLELPSIWAPAVREGRDGRFYFYTSTDHNIYAGVADHPMGPFTNLLEGDSIFIKNRQWWDKMHSIDADCFIDKDGEIYLYWGSGFEFKNGVCAVGVLEDDMSSFKKEPVLITPENYFEGPHMMERDGIYYLMYSDGFYYDSSYQVHYAISDNPEGPFRKGKNNPILKSTTDGLIKGPGHHYTMKAGDAYYIIYHKHAYPAAMDERRLIRQICIDRLEFEADGSIKKIEVSKDGVLLDFPLSVDNKQAVYPNSVSSSSTQGEQFDASKAFDKNFGTLWAAEPGSEAAWLMAEFEETIEISSCSPVFDRVMAPYSYRIEYNDGGDKWNLYFEGENSEHKEWPFEIERQVHARKLRISIFPGAEYDRVGLWEFNIYSNK